jgi:hydrogenase nickel incorporation protein HypA/HybF
MHELSIALSILDLASEQAEQHGGGHIVVIHLKLGSLSGVVKEALLSSFQLARAGSPFEECELAIEEVPVVGYCSKCAAERAVPSIQELGCSVCGTPMSQILRGRELEVVALEIES